jgi:hypothetical protein
MTFKLNKEVHLSLLWAVVNTFVDFALNPCKMLRPKLFVLQINFFSNKRAVSFHSKSVQKTEKLALLWRHCDSVTDGQQLVGPKCL